MLGLTHKKSPTTHVCMLVVFPFLSLLFFFFFEIKSYHVMYSGKLGAAFQYDY
jgi:hypothetical protein